MLFRRLIYNIEKGLRERRINLAMALTDIQIKQLKPEVRPNGAKY